MRSRSIPRNLALAALLAVFGCATSDEPFAYDLAAELMSPFCPGRTVAACPSPQAAELVQWMVMQEASGASREDVIQALIDDYGEGILGAPPAEGITRWAYALPVVGFVGGGGVAAFVLWRMASGRRREDKAEVARDGTPTAEGDSAASSASPHAEPPAAQGTTDAGPQSEEDDELARIVDRDLAE